MSKFKWRLQRVLEIKNKQQQLKRAELLKLTQRLVSMQSRLLMEKTKLKKMADDINNKDAKSRIPAQRLFINYSQTTNQYIKQIENEIKELYQQKQKKIAEIREIQRAQKTLEKLREKAKEEFVNEHLKQEQKLLDENFISTRAVKLS
jgi:flagellar FliJ protein